MFKAHQWWAEGHLVCLNNAARNSLGTGLKGRQEGVSWWGKEEHWEGHSLIFIFTALACLGWDLFVSTHRVLQKQQRFILKPCSELLFSVAISNMKKSNPSTSVCSIAVHSHPKSSRFQSEHLIFPTSPLALFGASHASSFFCTANPGHAGPCPEPKKIYFSLVWWALNKMHQ